MTSDADVKLRLYDTYAREKRDFVPLDPAHVRMYACGPTVYDYAHIGNARPAIVFDVLFRLLRHLAKLGTWDNGVGQTKVTYVRNITDVDDKINARAARDYPDLPLNAAIRKVTESTHAQYIKDVTALGCLEPTHQPRATETIEEMVAMIVTLIDKKHAYEAEGHVLFDVKSWKEDGELEYGKLSRRSLDDMIAGARVEVAPYKRDPMDFVLWKPSTGEEPGWPSPWGRGRPGWHIECSAMSEKFLGKQFDIHGGGIDLSFPHHENELAQSCCAHGLDRMANFWMHNGFLQVEGKKMSKSEGNFITIHELLETDKFGGRKWPGEVLRLAMLMTHYREPIDFSVKRLEEAETLLDGWRREIVKRGISFAAQDRNATEAERPCAKVVAGLANDLNMSEVLAALHWHAGGKEDYNGPRLWGSLQFLGILTFASMVAWIEAEAKAQTNVDSGAVENKIQNRLDALNAKDFAKADAIRAELLEQGIQLMDYKDPDTGERKTKWEVKR